MSANDRSSGLMTAPADPAAEAIERRLQDYERWFRVLDEQTRALERERRKLSAIVAHADAGFLLVDGKLKVTWTNELFSREFAAEESPEAVVGRSCCRVLCRRDEACEVCPPAESFRTRTVSHHEIHLADGDRSRHLYATSIPITSACGSVEEALIMLQDVSDLQVLMESQKALKASEERFRSIFEKTAAGMAIVALDGTFIQANPALCRLLGYEEAELKRLKVFDVTHPEDRKATRRRYREVHNRERTAVDVEKRYVRKDGVTVWAHTSTNWFVNEEGCPTHSVALIQDITRRKRLEEELHHTEKMSAVGRLVAGVAHEINNPLAGVLGFAQILLQSDLSDNVRRGLETISSEAERCRRIVGNLQTFARRHKPQQELVDINELLESTLELQAYQLNVDNIRVVKGLDPDLPRTVGDPCQLRQVFLNIIVNAHQAMCLDGKAGVLTLRTRRKASVIEVEIQDEGLGIAPENLGRIFDPFFSTKDVGQGSGLGLSICYGIIEQHQGKISARNAPGGGAVICVVLPIRSAPREQRGDRAERVGDRNEEVSPGRILVVDDELVILDILGRALKLDGHRVDTAINGSTAIAKIERESYDLIISDLKMPGMSGQALYDKVRQIDPAVAERMTFATGDVVSEGTRIFLERTGARCLLKPFDVSAARKFVREALLAIR